MGGCNVPAAFVPAMLPAAPLCCVAEMGQALLPPVQRWLPSQHLAPGLQGRPKCWDDSDCKANATAWLRRLDALCCVPAACVAHSVAQPGCAAGLRQALLATAQ